LPVEGAAKPITTGFQAKLEKYSGAGFGAGCLPVNPSFCLHLLAGAPTLRSKKARHLAGFSWGE
jgi:hypothetical protein